MAAAVLKLRVLRDVEPTELDVRGTFGVSTHTAKDVFWLATGSSPAPSEKPDAQSTDR